LSYTNQDDSTNLEGSTDGMVQLENGLVKFDSYELYKQKAIEARNYLLSLDVKPESEQECKKVVAAARKISEALNQEKIRIKKQILAPYNTFEAQVKEIIGIVTEGEDVARDKLRDIDAQRQEEKKAAIRKIWDARVGSFESGKYFKFEDFLTPQHLNKTVSINTVEKEMVQFFTDTSWNIEFLEDSPLKHEYIAEYVKCKNVTQAIKTVDDRHKAVKELSKDPYIVIKVTGKAGVILAKQLLSEIDYEVLEEK